jgi:DNA-binding HxlR family transcriptional regulator
MASRVPLREALQDVAHAVVGSLSKPRARAVRPLSQGSRLSAPLAIALERIPSRRRLLLAWHLFWGPRRFEDLLPLTAGIPKRTLRLELGALEAEGLVERRARPDEAEAEAEYALTPLGEALKPALASLYLWGLRVQGAGAAARAPESWSDELTALLRSADSG